MEDALKYWAQVFTLLDEMEKCVDRIHTMRLKWESQTGFGEG